MYAETDNSPCEEQKEYLDLQPVEPKNLKEGKFDLIGFKGDYEDDIKITALKRTNDECKVFILY